MTPPARKPTPAVRVDLPGGATLARAGAEHPTCSCGDAITLTGSDDVQAADRAWFAARHAECATEESP